VVVRIGIDPISQVSYEVNYDTAVQCKELLIYPGITDVEVEMRQSRITRDCTQEDADAVGLRKRRHRRDRRGRG